MLLQIYIPGSAGGLTPRNRIEGSTGLYKIFSPELPPIPLPVANPVAEQGTLRHEKVWEEVPTPIASFLRISHKQRNL